MTPVIRIAKRDRGPHYMAINMRDEEEDLSYSIVVPCFGPNHRAGLDCWCCPEMDEDGVIVHEVAH